MHGEVKLRVVVLYGSDKVFHMNQRVKFFLDFALQCLLGAFASFYLSAGKFPLVFPFSVASLCGEHLVVVADDGSYYFYAFLFLHVLDDIQNNSLRKSSVGNYAQAILFIVSIYTYRTMSFFVFVSLP